MGLRHILVLVIVLLVGYYVGANMKLNLPVLG